MKLSKELTEKLKKTFMDLCRIDNPSRHEMKMADWIKKRVSKYAKDFKIDKKYNVFFRVPGQGEPILLNAHIDCVEPCRGVDPYFDGKSFYSKGDTILGGDDLVGVSSILLAIEIMRSKKIKHRPLEILFTTMEEIGGVGIKNFDFSNVISKKAVTIDSLASVGSFVVKSPTKYNFTLSFQGISVHGQGADKGVSAIKMMAELLSKLPLGKVKKNVTLNIGIINGGKSLNTVPGESTVMGSFKISSEGEIRSDKRKEAQDIIDMIYKKIKKIQKKYPKGDIIFDHQLNRPGYTFCLDDGFIKEIKKALKNCDLKPKGVESLGVSDANTLNAMGIKTVLIGTGVKHAHTVNETVSLEDLKKLTEIVLSLSAENN